jgi:hypothetical protein
MAILFDHMSLDPSPTSNVTMPSEFFFKKQAGRAQKALSNFKLVSSLSDASALIRAAMTELVDATDAFNGFLSHRNHSLFQEVPIMVQATLDDFLTKNPKFDVPKNFHKIAGLVARIRDSQGKTQTPAKRLASTQSFLAVPGRPERVKRVRPLAKRLRMSKDTVGDTDDEMPPLSYDNSSPTTSKQPPLPNEPIDFGNTPEIKAAVDSGQFGKVPTSVVTDSGSPFPTQAMDLGPDFPSSDTVILAAEGIGRPSSKALALLNKTMPPANTLAPFDRELLIGVLSDLDRDSLIRARELITDLVMSEIQHEDPKGQSSFEDAVRHQIVASCQRIRILLLVTDQLMGMYNDAVTTGKITPQAGCL